MTDMILTLTVSKSAYLQISYSHYWKEGIDGYLDIEKSKVVPKVVARGMNSSVQTPTAIDSKPKEPMTFDKAVEM